MRIDQLNVVLRERSSFEAMELGTALVRRQARTVWGVWLLVGLPLFALFNGLAWWHGDAFGWAWLAMWWCKPVFERITLYVLSRDVFGEAVSIGQALRAQRRWDIGGFWGYLGWRRFSMFRAVCLPVNLLEDADAAQRAQRRQAVLATAAGPTMVLTLLCLMFEVVLVVGGLAAVFVFMPLELMSDSWRAAWDMIQRDTPAWAKLGLNLLWWLAACTIGPFHIGAGFGMYLNRRTQMEAWDVEISFRRLRARLQRSTSAGMLLVLVALLPLWPGAVHAQAGDTTTPTKSLKRDPVASGEKGNAVVGTGPILKDRETKREALRKRLGAPRNAVQRQDDTPAGIFGNEPVDTAGFRQAVQRAYEDPLQRPTRTETHWERRVPATDATQAPRDTKLPPEVVTGAVALIALVTEWGLWILVGLLVLGLLLTARRWLPWMRGSGRRRAPVESAVGEDSLVLPDILPPDIATRARELWRQGRPRQALALLYRASVDTVAERSGVVLPPGATEGQVLRASRRMAEAGDRDAFAAIVRLWQYAAYADRLPDFAVFDEMAARLQAQYRWPA